MDSLKDFYEIKQKAIENIENSIIMKIDIEQYLKNYEKLYRWYLCNEDNSSKEYQKMILQNIKNLVENQKKKIKNQLEDENCNLIEISNQYSNFIVLLFSLREQYPEFKDSIIIDDLV